MFKWLNESYEDRVKAVVHFQRFRGCSTLLDLIARIATFCSAEEFYLALFPILYWGPYCDAKLGYNLCVCVGLGLPIGNILKNTFCVRRPNSPQVWQYHTSNEEHEFALPSTHALLSASVSIYTALHHMSHYDHYQSVFLILAWLLFVVAWTACISLSRVFLGAHSFQDIFLGSVIGMIHGLLLSVLLEVFHETLVEGSYWVMLCCLSFLLVVLHSHPIDKSSRLNFHLSEGTFDYTSPLLGLALGGMISRSWYFPVQEYCIPSWDFSLFIRYLFGFPISVASYFAIKKTLPHIIEPIMKSLKIKAHYISYSDYAKYLAQEIKCSAKLEDSPGVDVVTGAAASVEETNGKVNGKNPEYLLAWVRIYTKLILYVGLTFTVSVIVPLVAGLILNNKK